MEADRRAVALVALDGGYFAIKQVEAAVAASIEAGEAFTAEGDALTLLNMVVNMAKMGHEFLADTENLKDRASGAKAPEAQ